MGLFIVWLRYSPADGTDTLARGPGARPARSAGRIDRVLSAVQGFLSYAVTAKEAPGWALSQLYELADDRDLPLEARSEDTRLAYRMKARHRLHEPENAVDRASDEEIMALLSVCRSARNRLIVLLMGRAAARGGC